MPNKCFVQKPFRPLPQTRQGAVVYTVTSTVNSGTNMDGAAFRQRLLYLHFCVYGEKSSAFSAAGGGNISAVRSTAISLRSVTTQYLCGRKCRNISFATGKHISIRSLLGRYLPSRARDICLTARDIYALRKRYSPYGERYLRFAQETSLFFVHLEVPIRRQGIRSARRPPRTIYKKFKEFPRRTLEKGKRKA
jgi:hypothetical protein